MKPPAASVIAERFVLRIENDAPGIPSDLLLDTLPEIVVDCWQKAINEIKKKKEIEASRFIV